MHRIYKKRIEPLLHKYAPKSILEIGAFQGKNTSNLLDFCSDNDSYLYCIDPKPKFDPNTFQSVYGQRFCFFEECSLPALKKTPPVDFVLIDGDHNWYTVFNELLLITEKCIEAMPIILIHDVDEPCARRDFYYNVNDIPVGFLHPYETHGGRKNLPESLDWSVDLHWALHSGGDRNGVLTAVEDFLQYTDRFFYCNILHGDDGLCILYDEEFI